MLGRTLLDPFTGGGAYPALISDNNLSASVVVNELQQGRGEPQRVWSPFQLHIYRVVVNNFPDDVTAGYRRTRLSIDLPY